MEYPAIQLSDSNKTNISKLQRIQNKATRFITNSKLLDFNKSEVLHQRTKLEPINKRLHKLKIKTLTKMHGKYIINDNSDYYYNPTEYSIENECYKKRKKSLAKLINENIFTSCSDRSLNCFNIRKIQGMSEPIPKFT